jgi:hypothetical protein
VPGAGCARPPSGVTQPYSATEVDGWQHNLSRLSQNRAAVHLSARRGLSHPPLRRMAQAGRRTCRGPRAYCHRPSQCMRWRRFPTPPRFRTFAPKEMERFNRQRPRSRHGMKLSKRCNTETVVPSLCRKISKTNQNASWRPDALGSQTALRKVLIQSAMKVAAFQGHRKSVWNGAVQR